ncbi:MAG: hypothetical protein PHS59_07765 [Paludibacter sp.]|nr:hypothetical protein [Paludibacter sp.]
MYKITILLLFISLPFYAQQNYTFATVDSLSYNYFVNGNWNELINISKEAEHQKIDFKYLQQRVGYAYFMKKDYYKAIKHYTKSLIFDKTDEISHLYLYYSALNIGDESMARYHFSLLSLKLQESLDTKKFSLISAIDLEYNYKINNSELRTNPNYTRIGVNSSLGYRLNLYQTLSRYNQTTDYVDITQQDEYFGSLSYSLFDRTNINFGYHYVNTKITTDPDSYLYPGKVLYGKLSQRINRFDIGINASVFNSDLANASQLGIEIGYVIPSKVNLYLKSSIYNVKSTTYDLEDIDTVSTNSIIFSQKIGLFALKNIWLEASLTLGNLNNFVDTNGMYLYNSTDPTTFRTGTSVFWYLNKHLIIYSNYTFDHKLIIDDTQENYKQHSITGGIIWKI